MGDVGKERSRIIEMPNGSVLVDATDAILVDEIRVVSKHEGDANVLGMEVEGRVNNTDDRRMALLLIDPEGAAQIVGLLVVHAMEGNKAIGPELLRYIAEGMT